VTPCTLPARPRSSGRADPLRRVDRYAVAACAMSPRKRMWTREWVLEVAQEAYRQGYEDELDHFLDELEKAGALDALNDEATMLHCVQDAYRMAGTVAFRAMADENSPLLQDAGRRKALFVLALRSTHGGERTKQFIDECAFPEYFADINVLQHVPDGPNYFMAERIPTSFLQSRQVMLQPMTSGKLFVQLYPWALLRASSQLRSDWEVVMCAVSQAGAGAVLKAASPELREDYDIVRAAVQTDAMALQHVRGEMRHDLQLLCLAATSPAFPNDHNTWAATDPDWCDQWKPYVFEEVEQNIAAFLLLFEQQICLEAATSAPKVSLLLVKRFGWKHVESLYSRFLSCTTFLSSAFDDCLDNIYAAIDCGAVRDLIPYHQTRLVVCIMRSAHKSVLNETLSDYDWHLLKTTICRSFQEAWFDDEVRHVVELAEPVSRVAGYKRKLSCNGLASMDLLCAAQTEINERRENDERVEQCYAELQSVVAYQISKRDAETFNKDALVGAGEVSDDDNTP